MDKIILKGCRQHNLKNIDLEIPRDKLVVITGLSGSGKSSLAFDTIYAEGQRRYVESLSAYARQFLGQMDKPDVDSIDGLSPAIAIEQKTTSKNPRSTVGTVTEIYDYLRLLFARIGKPYCYICGREIAAQTVQQITDAVMALPAETRIQVLAPIVRGRKGEYRKELMAAAASGYVRARVDGEIRELAEPVPMDKKKKHNIEIIIDRLVVKPGIERRLAESIESGAQAGRRHRAHQPGRQEAGPPVQREALVHRGRHQLSRDRPEHLLLQQPAGRLPDLRRPGRAARVRPGARHPEQEHVHPGRRHQALGKAHVGPPLRTAPVHRRKLRLRRERAGQGAEAVAAQGAALRHRRGRRTGRSSREHPPGTPASPSRGSSPISSGGTTRPTPSSPSGRWSST